MWRRLSDLLGDRVRHADWRPNIEAAAAEKNVQKTLREYFPRATGTDVSFLSYRNGVVTLKVSHPSVHHALREHEEQIRRKIQDCGTPVTVLQIRLIPPP